MQNKELSHEQIRSMRRSYMASVVAWRACARNVREHATTSHLSAAAKAALLRSAQSCDEMADVWVKGLIEDFIRPRAPL